MIQLLCSEHNSRFGQIVGGHFNRHLVTGQNADVMHTHLARDKTVYYMTIFKFDLEGGVGEIIDHLTLQLNNIFLGHGYRSLSSASSALALEIGFLEQAFVLMRHDVGLHLRHEVHRHHHNN